MPRQLRRFNPGSLLHVIARGNRRQAIFESREDWTRFRCALLRELAAEEIPLAAWCLMPNHFHIVVQAAFRDALSRAMHRLLTSHAAYMNKKYGRTGHLFEDRYKSFVCPPEGLKDLILYVHRNPVRARLVRSIEQWPWSSHRDLIDPSSTELSGRDLALSAFDPDPGRAVATYLEHAGEGRDSWDATDEKPPLAAICARVEREHGHSPGALRQRSKRRDLAATKRAFIASAASAGYKSVEVAQFLGVTESAVSKWLSDVENGK